MAGWAQGLAFLGLLALLLAPRLLPGRAFAAPDAPPPALALALDPVALGQQPGYSFPGSAYFFMQGAFDVRSADVPENPHILSINAGPAAAPTLFRAASPSDRGRALNCLTAAIYYEAANEPVEGQRAVAQVVLNRVRHPAWPDSICAVVYQDSQRTDLRCQFTFTCDGALLRPPLAAKWRSAMQVAQQALAGDTFPAAGLATNYHTLAVRPNWAAYLTPVAVVGAHIFYRLPGPAGAPARFSERYSGRETPPPPYRPPSAPMTAPLTPPPPPAAWAGGGAGAGGVEYPATASSNPGEPAWSLGRPGIADDGRTAPPPSGAPTPRLPESRVRPEYAAAGRPLI